MSLIRLIIIKRLCFVLFLFQHLTLFYVSNYFYWYRSGWSEEELVTLLDLALKALAWGVVGVCLQKGFFFFFSSGDRRFPLLFRTWCVFYLFVFCYCFVVDIVLVYEKHVALPAQYLVSEVVSACVGLFFCYFVCFVRNECEFSTLEETLLNGDAHVSDNKKGAETVTPYSNAGISAFLHSLGLVLLLLLAIRRPWTLRMCHN
ncbi:hypothetical protein HN51_049151 [Arachis hypogaea]